MTKYSKNLHKLIRYLLTPSPDLRPDIFQVAFLAFKLAGKKNTVQNLNKVPEPNFDNILLDTTHTEGEKDPKSTVSVESSAVQPSSSGRSTNSVGACGSSADQALVPGTQGALTPVLSGSTSVAPRQRPRGTGVGASGRSGALPSLPAAALIGALPAHSKPTAATSNIVEGTPVAAATAAIDNFQPRPQAHLSTNPFAQSPASGLPPAQVSHNPSESIGSNPFIISSHTAASSTSPSSSASPFHQQHSGNGNFALPSANTYQSLPCLSKPPEPSSILINQTKDQTGSTDTANHKGTRGIKLLD